MKNIYKPEVSHWYKCSVEAVFWISFQFLWKKEKRIKAGFLHLESLPSLNIMNSYIYTHHVLQSWQNKDRFRDHRTYKWSDFITTWPLTLEKDPKVTLHLKSNIPHFPQQSRNTMILKVIKPAVFIISLNDCLKNRISSKYLINKTTNI